MENKERLFEVIRKPLITERATQLASESKFVFEVSSCANKNDIKKAIEFLFKVEVLSVNTINQIGKLKVFKGKLGKRKDYKKAIVTLKKGQTIDLAVGV